MRATHTLDSNERNLQNLLQCATKRCEIITLGNSSVGKTQLLSRFANNRFEEASESTIGVDFFYRNVTVESGKNNSFEMLVKCWDTAGQECFKFAMKQYFRGRQGCVFVFAVDDYPSFKNLSEWITSLKDSNPDAFSIIVANKCDLSPKYWKVSKKEYNAFAKEQNLDIFETSAKTSDGVMTAFNTLMESVCTVAQPINKNTKNSLGVSSSSLRHGGCC